MARAGCKWPCTPSSCYACSVMLAFLSKVVFFSLSSQPYTHAEHAHTSLLARITQDNDLGVKGEADKEAVVQHCLGQFSNKFDFFVKHIQVSRERRLGAAKAG